ncbi:hypothetical protein BECAL_03048 [Bellilinea caldifistulae]|uniref:Uncharacterized protein n=1 Tax=Bellilinea caldifistulae TaxID=360411 RepID=A0A0P6XIH0_9CHLR|nr:hypothetical protein [Bellilinea caldifistulae]KPL70923.1 hypothetical protein AC812_16490 [Bellilinea caldifistulae]GAP11854.1 hypothetical protein BECAL_03048 [Bellilinea caldifistulae]
MFVFFYVFFEFDEMIAVDASDKAHRFHAKHPVSFVWVRDDGDWVWRWEHGMVWPVRPASEEDWRR